MTRPRLLDLFCGAGGAAMGYRRAGFDVVGVDVARQPNYPFDFAQDDALAFLRRHGHEFDAVHASPPCQRYSVCAGMPNRDMAAYPDLVGPVRAELVRLGRPWVIENVPRAPMGGVVLCGTMFGLRVFRHRRFESSVLLLAPPHPTHRERIGGHKSGRLAVYTRGVGEMVTVAGHLFGLAAGSHAMGIDWMTRDELAEAIPPAYTHHVGLQVMAAVVAGRVAA